MLSVTRLPFLAIPGSVLVVVMVMVSCAPAAQAPKYPTKAIDYICAAAPGAGGDASARLVAPYVSKKLGVTVNVVNVAGASGVTGMLQAMNATPDGYTMFLEAAAQSSFMWSVRTDLPVKLEDKTFVARATAEYMYYLTNVNTGWKTLDDAVKAAKSNPGDFAWGAGLYGSSPMYNGIKLFMAAKMDFDTIKKTKIVVFDQGNAPALQALVAGDVKFGVSGPAELVGLLATGKVVPLATTAPQRTKEFPDVPTTKEAGYPDADLVTWYGVSGPKGLPDQVAKAWEDVVRAAEKDPEAIDQATKLKKTWAFMGASDFRNFVLKENEQATQIATALGFRK